MLSISAFQSPACTRGGVAYRPPVPTRYSPGELHFPSSIVELHGQPLLSYTGHVGAVILKFIVGGCTLGPPGVVGWVNTPEPTKAPASERARRVAAYALREIIALRKFGLLWTNMSGRRFRTEGG